MEEKRKAEHLLVIYANTGEHIMIEYDNFAYDDGEIKLYKNDNYGKCKLIAEFYRENLAGWECIR